MKPQVITIHKIFSEANMPPNFDEIDEKEESNDDSDASCCSDASRRVSLNKGQGSSQNGKTFGMVNKASHAQKKSMLHRSENFGAWNE
ncbi:hypothetical protein YC2023_104683 [Brassica napus]